jgi:sodium-coupled monocarboxylate transporter 8/12
MAEAVTLRWGDWLVVLGYLGLMFSIPVLLRRKEKTATDFFLAGRSMPWVFVGLSMYATLFSTISFVSMPGEGYKFGIIKSLHSVFYTAVSPLAVWVFLRFFYNTTSFSAYEYLERRFNLASRLLGACIFLISRALYASLALYSAAKIFEQLIGWPQYATVAVVMVVTVLYSFMGGMRTVIIADSVQTGLIILGLGVVVFSLGQAVGFDFSGAWTFATAQGHGYAQVMEPEFYSLDPQVRLSLWVLLITGVTTPFMNYGTDQLFVQKMLVTKSYNDAFKAVLLKTFAALPLTLLFYFSGLLLFYYYRGLNTPPAGVHPDAMLGYFISTHLTAPWPGVIVVALLAALMSTLDSTISSLSTIVSVDFVERLKPSLVERIGMFRLGRILTVVWGVIVTVVALVIMTASESIESTIAELAIVWASLWGVLLVVVLGGVFTKWVTARAAVAALGAGIVINLILPWPLYYAVPAADRISFVWVGVPGWIITALVLVGVSLLDPRKATALAGLTWGTARKP